MREEEGEENVREKVILKRTREEEGEENVRVMDMKGKIKK